MEIIYVGKTKHAKKVYLVNKLGHALILSESGGIVSRGDQVMTPNELDQSAENKVSVPFSMPGQCSSIYGKFIHR